MAEKLTRRMFIACPKILNTVICFEEKVRYEVRLRRGETVARDTAVQNITNHIAVESFTESACVHEAEKTLGVWGSLVPYT